MAYFHACSTELAAGQVLGPFVLSRFQERQKVLGRGWIEDVLELHRPPGAPTRKGAIFFSSTLFDCAAYAESEPEFKGGGRRPHYYQIDAEHAWSAPMALVGLLAAHDRDDPTTLAAIASEYWSSRRVWHYGECFASTVAVVSSVLAPAPMLVTKVRLTYAQDLATAKRLWPLRT